MSADVPPEITTPAEGRAIAKVAYIYGFPMVDIYRVQYSYFVDRKSPEFKAPWNQIACILHIASPADKALHTVNAGTPYCWIGMDLRAELREETLPAAPREPPPTRRSSAFSSDHPA